MTGQPTWLPPIININGEFDQVTERLYSVFRVGIKEARLTLRGLPVWWDRRIVQGSQYEEAFWHLITRKDLGTEERLLDPRRAERLPWCGPIISNATDGALKTWDYREGREVVRTYVWLEHCDYVVILEKRHLRFGDVFFLVTAYHVDGRNQRRILQNKYVKRII